MKGFVNGQMTGEVKATVNTQIFNANQTDKDQGHIIIDYPRLLNYGLGALAAELKTYYARQSENPFYQAVLILLETSQRHTPRYAALAEKAAGHCQDPQYQQELLAIAAISHYDAQHRPTDFPQVCQLFWYSNIILQYESNTSSISLGRFDQCMLSFYQVSLNQGQDLAYPKELLESLWVRCNDVVLLRSSSSTCYSAGLPTGYTTLLGGLTETGRSAVNVLSFLCLDVYQNVQLPQSGLDVRVNKLVDRPSLCKIAETVCPGTGIPQILNDEMAVPIFLNRGVLLEDARDCVVVGCVELSIPGCTYGLYDITMFNLLKVMEVVLQENEHQPDVSRDGLICQIRNKIYHCIRLMVKDSNICDIGHHDQAPASLLSSFIEDCVQHGEDIIASNVRYNFSGAQGIGIANLSDSLYTLKGTVFDQQRLSFDQLMAVLKVNFQMPKGEKTRAQLISRFDKHGNDIDDADDTSTDLLRLYCREVEQYPDPCGDHFTLGSYTVPAHVPLGSAVGATPDERLIGEQLVGDSLSSMVGQDSQGPTAVLKSVSKLGNCLLPNGTLLNTKFTPATLAGDGGLDKLANFLQASCKLKLQHIQLNMVNVDTLREVQQRPQDFAGLVVRVASCSALFVESSKEIQDDIIRHTAYQL